VGTGFDAYDVATQGLTSHHFELVDGRLERLSIPFRYVWPSELDLMAKMAGMTLRDRWSGWNREPNTSETRKHVSVLRETGAKDSLAEAFVCRTPRLATAAEVVA
jgi:hypothetical protein